MLSWFMLNVCFFLFMTRTEFPSLGIFAGLSYLVRGTAGMIIFLYFFLIHNLRLQLTSLTTSTLILTVFFIGNLQHPSLFSLIAGFGILAGLLLGGITRNVVACEILATLIRVYIKVNLFGIILSVIAYYGAGLQIDFHGIMFPWSESRARDFMGFFRVTGFQIEPGTYTATIYFCVLISAVMRRRVSGRLETFAILSTLITMSAWAVLAVSSYLCACLIEKLARRHNRLQAVVMLSGVGALALMASFMDLQDISYVQYFFERFSTDNASGSMVMKLEAWTAWKAGLESGMLFPRPLTEPFCPTCSSPQDLGTLLNMLWYVGFVFTLPYLAWLSFKTIRHVGIGLLIMNLPLVGAKFFFFDPSLWFYFGILLFLSFDTSQQRQTLSKKDARRVAN